jgi:hypothetical protein
MGPTVDGSFHSIRTGPPSLFKTPSVTLFRQSAQLVNFIALARKPFMTLSEKSPARVSAVSASPDRSPDGNNENTVSNPNPTTSNARHTSIRLKPAV